MELLSKLKTFSGTKEANNLVIFLIVTEVIKLISYGYYLFKLPQFIMIFSLLILLSLGIIILGIFFLKSPRK